MQAAQGWSAYFLPMPPLPRPFSRRLVARQEPEQFNVGEIQVPMPVPLITFLVALATWPTARTAHLPRRAM
jgi:hypothetical protein